MATGANDSSAQEGYRLLPVTIWPGLLPQAAAKEAAAKEAASKEATAMEAKLRV